MARGAKAKNKSEGTVPNRPVNHNGRMKPRLFAFVVWAAVAGSVMFWGLRLLVSAQPVPGHALSVGDAGTVVGDVTRLLGTTPKETVAIAAAAPVSELSTRLKLTGVMAAKSKAGQGVALISVDGKPARAFSVGSRIDGDSNLQAVSLRTASISLGSGKAPVVLEMPPMAVANTGTLPTALQMGGNAGTSAQPFVAQNTPAAVVSGSTGTVPRGLPFNPAALSGKISDGTQLQPANPQATMQGNQPAAQ